MYAAAPENKRGQQEYSCCHQYFFLDKYFFHYAVKCNQAKEENEIEENNIGIIAFKCKNIKYCHKLYYNIAFQVIPVCVVAVKNITAAAIAMMKNIRYKARGVC